MTHELEPTGSVESAYAHGEEVGEKPDKPTDTPQPDFLSRVFVGETDPDCDIPPSVHITYR